MAKNNDNDIVTIKCYGKEEKMTRKKAIAKYKKGAMMCEGSEKERYTDIYLQLIDGELVCTDE